MIKKLEKEHQLLGNTKEGIKNEDLLREEQTNKRTEQIADGFTRAIREPIIWLNVY